MRYYLSFLLCLLLVNFAIAQEEQTPYEIALERIEAARVSGATVLNLFNLGLAELPPEIGNIVNLQRLYLDRNQLTSLPPEIGNLSNLQELYLTRNQLSYLPPEIGNLDQLQELHIANNHLTQLLPEIGGLSNLQELDLYQNRLSSLPSEIGNLSNLQWLILDNNQLSSLPNEIANLRNLCYLNIRANLFQTIPPEIHPLKSLGENCNGLQGLYLDETLLYTLPEEVQAGGTLAILNYLENQAWWHLQRLIAGGAGSIGLLSVIILGWRWKNRRGKSKRKNEEI